MQYATARAGGDPATAPCRSAAPRRIAIPNGSPRLVYGANSIEHTVQDQAKLKVGVDLSDRRRRAVHRRLVAQPRRGPHAQPDPRCQRPASQRRRDQRRGTDLDAAGQRPGAHLGPRHAHAVRRRVERPPRQRLALDRGGQSLRFPALAGRHRQPGRTRPPGRRPRHDRRQGRLGLGHASTCAAPARSASSTCCTPACTATATCWTPAYATPATGWAMPMARRSARSPAAARPARCTCRMCGAFADAWALTLGGRLEQWRAYGGLRRRRQQHAALRRSPAHRLLAQGRAELGFRRWLGAAPGARQGGALPDRDRTVPGQRVGQRDRQQQSRPQARDRRIHRSHAEPPPEQRPLARLAVPGSHRRFAVLADRHHRHAHRHQRAEHRPDAQPRHRGRDQPDGRLDGRTRPAGQPRLQPCQDAGGPPVPAGQRQVLSRASRNCAPACSPTTASRRSGTPRSASAIPAASTARWTTATTSTATAPSAASPSPTPSCAGSSRRAGPPRSASTT